MPLDEETRGALIYLASLGLLAGLGTLAHLIAWKVEDAIDEFLTRHNISYASFLPFNKRDRHESKENILGLEGLIMPRYRRGLERLDLEQRGSTSLDNYAAFDYV